MVIRIRPRHERPGSAKPVVKGNPKTKENPLTNGQKATIAVGLLAAGGLAIGLYLMQKGKTGGGQSKGLQIQVNGKTGTVTVPMNTPYTVTLSGGPPCVPGGTPCEAGGIATTEASGAPDPSAYQRVDFDAQGNASLQFNGMDNRITSYFWGTDPQATVGPVTVTFQ